MIEEVAYATLAYISNIVLKLKSGNKALIAAVFLATAGLFSSFWFTSENRIIQESNAFSTPVLVQTAQAQGSLPVIAAVYNGALAEPVGPVNALDGGDVSPLTNSLGAMKDPGSLAGPAAVSATALLKVNAAQLAHQSGTFPDLDSDFVMPTKGHNLGILHNYNAVDITSACGTPVLAAAAGLVVPDENNPNALDGWNGGYGNFVFLEHSFGDGIFTRYAHLEKSLVGVGDSVKQGQEIGLVGKTGDATGCRLDFEVIGAKNPLVKQ